MSLFMMPVACSFDPKDVPQGPPLHSIDHLTDTGKTLTVHILDWTEECVLTVNIYIFLDILTRIRLYVFWINAPQFAYLYVIYVIELNSVRES